MGLPTPAPEIETRLRQYQALLLKWQERINLISPSTAGDSWNRHFLDSLQVAGLLPQTPAVLYDLGSGGGFPGMVLAMARPSLSVTLVESDSKKCAFLQTVSRETGTSVVIVNDRIETATSTLPAPDIVSARALASLSELLSYIHPWTVQNPQLQALFLKGAKFEEEMAQAKNDGWLFHVKQKPSETDPGGRILWLSDIQKA
jgi:16S rRNA (guanine527-N7)-methyltransferase